MNTKGFILSVSKIIGFLPEESFNISSVLVKILMTFCHIIIFEYFQIPTAKEFVSGCGKFSLRQFFDKNAENQIS